MKHVCDVGETMQIVLLYAGWLQTFNWQKTQPTGNTIKGGMAAYYSHLATCFLYGKGFEGTVCFLPLNSLQ
jgi:hypothetical protein